MKNEEKCTVYNTGPLKAGKSNFVPEPLKKKANIKWRKPGNKFPPWAAVMTHQCGATVVLRQAGEQRLHHIHLFFFCLSKWAVEKAATVELEFSVSSLPFILQKCT